MKLLKIFSGLLVVLVLLFVVLAFFVVGNINTLVKSAVEDIGSDTLKTAVTLDEVDIRLLESKVQITGLKVANPSGFTELYAFEMDNIGVDFEPAALLNNLVYVQEVTIDGARVAAEQVGVGTNLQALLNNIDNGGDEATAPEPQPTKEPSQSAPLVKVGLFSFENSAMVLLSEKWGRRELSLPAIKLEQIGGESGLPPEQIGEAILRPLIKQLNGTIKERLKDLIDEKAKQKLREKEDELKGKLRGKLEAKLGDDTDETVDALKSLLKR